MASFSRKSQMPDPFQHHADNLAGKKVVITSTDFHPGYYKVWKGKGLPYAAGSIYVGEDGILAAERDGKPVPLTEDLWLSMVKRPISYETYIFHREHGRWPDDPVLNPVAVVGHNQPPPDGELPLDPDQAVATEPSTEAERDEAYEALLAEIEERTTVAREVYRELTVQPIAERGIADKAQNVADLLMRKHREAKALKDERKRPYLDACGQIEDYFRDLIARPKDIADKLKDRILAWQHADRAERQRVADEEAAAVAEARRIAFEQAQEAAKQREEPPPPPPPETKPTDVDYRALGGSVAGRRTKPRGVVKARIVDQDAVYMHFREHADVHAVLQRLANAAIKKMPVPGCEEERGEKI